MVNYQRTKIYMIYSKSHPEDIYIGSTCRKYIESRFSEHFSRYNSWCNDNNNMYCCSYKLFQKYDDCIIELIEDYPCNTNKEKLLRERHWIETLKCINTKMPIQLPHEKKEYNKKWSIENKQYYKDYREKHKERYKKQKEEYYKKNKEVLDKKNKEHYEKNKEAIKAQKREKITCPCGGKTTRGHMSRHKKTKMHIQWMSTQ